ncbi:Uncharacterized glycosyltransferase YkcC [Gammaproteobacteria bacterium]
MMMNRSDAELPESREPRLSVVVPCFNEQQSLQELYGRVTQVCRQTVNDSYELVLVDDGSTDGTWPLIAALAAQDPHVVAVSLSRNHGHQLALSAGLAIAAGARVLILDADLQDPPELLPEMMVLMSEGADVVYGRRDTRQGESWSKKQSSALFYRILNQFADIDIPLDTGDFRLITRRVLEVLNKMPEQYRFVRGMVSWVGFRQVPIFYERRERFAGSTKYSWWKMLRLAVDAITAFSIRPMQVASFLGFLFGMLSLAGVTYALGGWLMGHTIPGWTSVIIAVMILGSIQLLVLGIFGEYLGRLYIEAKRRPLFTIAQIIRHPDNPQRSSPGGSDHSFRSASQHPILGTQSEPFKMALHGSQPGQNGRKE